MFYILFKLLYFYIILVIIGFYIFNNTYNNCIDSNVCFRNLSIIENSNSILSCSETNSIILPFKSNRKWNNNPNFVVTTLYMYASENYFYKYYKFIKSFSIHNKGEILLLVSFNISLYSCIFSSNYISEIRNNNYQIKYFQNLDYGYKVFRYSYNDSFCYIIYTNVNQHFFSIDFLNNTHYTMNKRKKKFTGYYAASTNLYAVIPFMLRIFDYFDYYFKYDFDKPGFINIREFAFSKHQTNQWYLFGTCIKLDASYVCSNIKRMIKDFLKTKNCSSNILSTIDILTNDCIEYPGWFTGMWLGLYSSNEMKEFSNYYITYNQGIKYFRWGDQQFFVNSLLLFCGRSKISYNLTYNCIINNF